MWLMVSGFDIHRVFALRPGHPLKSVNKSEHSVDRGSPQRDQ